jgi:hypothetical protein
LNSHRWEVSTIAMSGERPNLSNPFKQPCAAVQRSPPPGRFLFYMRLSYSFVQTAPNKSVTTDSILRRNGPETVGRGTSHNRSGFGESQESLCRCLAVDFGAQVGRDGLPLASTAPARRLLHDAPGITQSWSRSSRRECRSTDLPALRATPLRRYLPRSTVSFRQACLTPLGRS